MAASPEDDLDARVRALLEEMLSEPPASDPPPGDRKEVAEVRARLSKRKPSQFLRGALAGGATVLAAVGYILGIYSLASDPKPPDRPPAVESDRSFLQDRDEDGIPDIAEDERFIKALAAALRSVADVLPERNLCAELSPGRRLVDRLTPAQLADLRTEFGCDPPPTSTTRG